MALSITPAGPFTITVGTMNYSQPITVVDSTAATDVTLEGDWEGFYMDWDQPNGTLYIRAAEVTRLVGEYVWLVTATEGMTTVTEDIVYSVVPAAPIILNPGNLVFYQGASNPDPDIMDGNYKFVEILNEPATALVEGDLLGMKATLGTNQYDAEQMEMGVFIEGDVPTGAVFSDGPFTCDIFASNDGGEVTLANVPVFITGPNPPSNLMFTSSPAGLRVGWDPPTIGLPILDYRITRIDVDGNATTATATGTSHTLKNVENGMEYTIRLEARNATGYSPIVQAVTIHEFATFIWIASGTSIYKLDAATLELAEGFNTIDLSGRGLNSSQPISDLTFGDGNLYALVHRSPNRTGSVLYRINPVSGQITATWATNILTSSRTVYGIAYEVQSGDDALWLNDGSNSRLYKTQPPGTGLGSYIFDFLPQGQGIFFSHIRGIEYYETALWVLNRNLSTIYEVTDDLPDGNSQTVDRNHVLEGSTVLQDANGDITNNGLVGIAIGEEYLWSVDYNGTVYKHNISDLSFDSETEVADQGPTVPRAICYQAGD